MKQNSQFASPDKTKLMTLRRLRVETRLLKFSLAVFLFGLLAIFPALSIVSSDHSKGFLVNAAGMCFFGGMFTVMIFAVRRQKYIENTSKNIKDTPPTILIEILGISTSIKPPSAYLAIYYCARRAFIGEIIHLQEQDIAGLSVMQRRAFYGLMELDDANLVVPLMQNAPEFGNADTLRHIKKMLNAKNFQAKYPAIHAAAQTAAELLEEKLALRNSPHTLLRASAPPAVSPGELLRAVACQPDTRPEQLLRPIQEPKQEIKSEPSRI